MAASGKDEDEDYWAASSATKIKSNVNLFDDSVNLEDAKVLLKKQMFDDVDDEEVDTINWDGSFVPSSGRVEYTKSARYRPGAGQGSTPGGSGVSSGAVAGRTIAGIPTGTSGHVRASSLGTAQPGIGGPNMTGTKSYSGEPSLGDIVGSGSSGSTGNISRTRTPTITEMSKLEAEINYLKRQLDATRKDRFAKIPPRETIKRIIHGKPYSLEPYKSKTDKLTLLDEAIRYHDGNAVIAIVLFLKNTVKNSIFTNAMMQRPVAVEQYISYLRHHFDYHQELVDFLGMLGRTEEAAMIKYKQAVSVQNAQTKLKNLKTCYQTHFGTDKQLTHDASLIQDQISLIEVQLPVEDSDVKAVRQVSNLRFKGVPREGSLLNKSVIDTLYYCCLYHYDLGENSLASPHALRKRHRLSDKQFVWVAINARSKYNRWNEIEELFKVKGWFGGTKLKPIVPFDKVIAILHEKGAPRDVLNKYCALIEDVDKRIEVASKHGCHETAIETFRNQRERQMLYEYTAKLKPHSQEWFYARDVLKDTTIKWKN